MVSHAEYYELSSDAYRRVKKRMCSFSNPSDCVSLLLPCLIELCKDNDAGVREAILNTVAVCLPYLTKGI